MIAKLFLDTESRGWLVTATWPLETMVLYVYSHQYRV